MSYLGAGADWRKRNYLIEPDTPVSVCANTGAVNRISNAAFDARTPGGVIDFTQFSIGTLNPVFSPASYGAVGSFQPYVLCGSLFYNQSYSPPGSMTGVVAAPPTLDLDSLGTFIANDTARLPSSTRCLSGSPFLNGSVAFVFVDSDLVTPKPVVGVSVNVGYMNSIGTARVTAYDVDANVLGVWLNTTMGTTPGNFPDGFEFFNLNRDSNTPIIYAITVENLGDDAGMTTSLVRFSNECA